MIAPTTSCRTAVFILVFLTIQGCTTTRVVSKYNCNTIANNPVNKKTTWSFFWGLVQPVDINPQCDPIFNHLNKVETKSNLGFAIITTATLGIVMPQRVTWCCAPPEIATDTLGH